MPDRNKPDLLIVDDDPLIADTLTYVLESDFKVYVAESRPQVKSLLRQLDRAPQLALSISAFLLHRIALTKASAS